ncbi:MAG: hypothetical protein ACFFDM_02270 [Candidatus Thorarchaeota archaeon]
MIENAILYDLLGSKALASITFSHDTISDAFLQRVLEIYYKLIQEDSARDFVTTEIEGHGTIMSKISEVTLIIGVTDSSEVLNDDIERMKRFSDAVVKQVEQSSVREFKDEFEGFAEALLKERIRICFVTGEDPSFDDKSGTAVDILFKTRGKRGRAYTVPTALGPFSAEIMRISHDSIVKADWSEDLSSADVFGLIVSPPLPTSDRVEQIVMRIREESSAKLIIIPGSDAELELAREYEEQYGLELCDSVSPKPTILLLSVMAMAGFIDMHAELALQSWIIDTTIDHITPDVESEDKAVNHQAFFVVDKKNGTAAYSYYYEEKSKLLEITPNIVAAISAFKFDPAKPNETSVFRTGDFNYITIERNDFVYTLITGKDANVEALRERFSFLPDLFMDEVPDIIENPTDLFRSPPFTLKLLATLPPETIPGRMAPKQARVLLWERFENAPVRDFLEAVWNRLDGTITMSRLVPGKGPEMMLGAVHLLNRLGAIKFELRIGPDDTPKLIGVPNDDVLSLYSRVDEVLGLVDGTRTIIDIANQLKLQPSVLVTVFAELHRREIVTIDEG